VRSDDDRLYAEFGLDPPDQKRGRRIDDDDRDPRVAKFDPATHACGRIDARCIWIDDDSAAATSIATNRLIPPPCLLLKFVDVWQVVISQFLIKLL
jgi:hypothetical protein